MKKALIACSIIANILLGIYGYRAHRFYSDMRSLKYLTPQVMRNEQIAGMPIDSNSIVFLGDSQTQSFELAERLADLNVKNRGVSGDDTQGVLNRTAQIAAAHPKKVFIQIGANDFVAAIKTDTAIAHVTAIINKITTLSPNTKIYLQGIFPCAKFNDKVILYDRQLSELAAKKHIVFIDLYAEFNDNGGLLPVYDCGDKLHITAAAYQKWTSILKKYL